MHELWAVSWNVWLGFLQTPIYNPTMVNFFVSALFEPTIVKMDLWSVYQTNWINQQVTNEVLYICIDSLVGTPEAVRPLSYMSLFCLNAKKTPDSSFNEWLAGVIDGDGCLLVSKDGYTSCEITVDLSDEPMLARIKQQLGGSIKLRSGVKALRWRLHNKEGMIKLVNLINGHIRNSVRVVQLQAVCERLGITYIPPLPLSLNSCWYAGFFDAEGSVSFSMKSAGNGNKKRPQLYISVTNKYHFDVSMFKERFGGPIYIDNAQNRYHKWMITKRELVLDFIEYAKICPIRSSKSMRLHLIPEYYYLVSMNAYDINAPINMAKAWLKFMDKWQKRSAE